MQPFRGPRLSTHTDVKHLAVFDQEAVRRRLWRMRLRNEVPEEDCRARPALGEQARELAALQLAVERVLFLPVVRDNDVDFGAVHVEGRVDGGSELAMRRREKMVRRAQNRELGDEGGACRSASG